MPAPTPIFAARSRRARITALSMGIGSAPRISVLLRLTGVVALVAAAVLLMRPAPASGPASAPPHASAADPSGLAVVGHTASPRALPIPDGFRVRVPRLLDDPLRDREVDEGIVERDIQEQRTPEGFAF